MYIHAEILKIRNRFLFIVRSLLKISVIVYVYVTTTIGNIVVSLKTFIHTYACISIIAVMVVVIVENSPLTCFYLNLFDYIDVVCMSASSVCMH